MRRVLLDTNIYGELAIDKELARVINNIKKEEWIIYGTKTIRQELRRTPKKRLFQEKNLRITMLAIYDKLVKNHNLEIKSNAIKLVAEYILTYKNLGGGKGLDEMRNDLMIVACASLNGLDIVASDDCHSLCSERALQAYRIVNDLKRLRTPMFLRYLEFRRWFV